MAAKTFNIKCCGFTQPDNALACVALAPLGLTHMGLIFVPNTPRAITLQQGAAITQAIKGPCQKVGVFQNADIDTVLHTVETVGLTMVQLHGTEPASQCQALMAKGIPVIKVLTADLPFTHTLAQASDYATAASIILLDKPKDSETDTAVWHQALAEQLAKHPLPGPWWLAGGLTAHNVQNILQAYQTHTCPPQGVDVASGVESQPGIKNPEQLRQFLAACLRHTS
jgi:phosphoribosylanthranilate isomerase